MLRNLVARKKEPQGLAVRDEFESPFYRLFHEMHDFFDDFSRRFEQEPVLGLERRRGEPLCQVNVAEDDKEVRVTAELPGMAEKDIELTLSKDTLTLKGEKCQETEEKDKNFYRQERCYGSFERIIGLPAEIDEKKVEATFKNGVLTVRLPKTETAQVTRRRITVKSE